MFFFVVNCRYFAKYLLNGKNSTFFSKNSGKNLRISKNSSTFAPSNKNKQQFKNITIMKTETTMSYKNFVEYCENLANELHTMMEAREYAEFGWASICFETDKFGGTYVCLHYDLKTGVVTNWYGSEHARVIDTLEQLRMMVKYYMKKMLKSRDMNAVSDFIN